MRLDQFAPLEQRSDHPRHDGSREPGQLFQLRARQPGRVGEARQDQALQQRDGRTLTPLSRGHETTPGQLCATERMLRMRLLKYRIPPRWRYEQAAGTATASRSVGAGTRW